MSFYSNDRWGYGAQGEMQNASFYGGHPPVRYTPAPFNMSMQNLGSFYDGMQQPSSFYAENALVNAPSLRPPSPMTDATVPAASMGLSAPAEGDIVTAYEGLGEVHMAPFYTATACKTAPSTSGAPPPVPGADGGRAEDTPPPLQRQNSSGRLLRRKVSFSGIPSKLPPEVETPKTTPTRKRKGSRRLNYSPSILSEDAQNMQNSTPPPPQPEQQGLQQQEPEPQPPPQLQLPPLQQQQQWQPLPQQQWQQQQLQRQQLWRRQQQRNTQQQQPQQQRWQPQAEPVETQVVEQQNYFYATELEEPVPQPPDAAQEEGPQPVSEQQPTLATSGPANSSQRFSFYRRNSQSMIMMVPYNPNGFGPFVQNYGMPLFSRPMCPPQYNVYRSVPFGMYNGNVMMYQRPVMTNYF